MIVLGKYGVQKSDIWHMGYDCGYSDKELNLDYMPNSGPIGLNDRQHREYVEGYIVGWENAGNFNNQV